MTFNLRTSKQKVDESCASLWLRIGAPILAPPNASVSNNVHNGRLTACSCLGECEIHLYITDHLGGQHECSKPCYFALHNGVGGRSLSALNSFEQRCSGAFCAAFDTTNNTKPQRRNPSIRKTPENAPEPEKDGGERAASVSAPVTFAAHKVLLINKTCSQLGRWMNWHLTRI